MRRRISQPDVSQAVPGRPSPVRYDSGRLSPGVTAANSNSDPTRSELRLCLMTGRPNEPASTPPMPYS